MNAAGRFDPRSLRGWRGLHGFSEKAGSGESFEEAIERAADREELLSEAMRIAGVGGWELDLATGTLSWSDETFRIFGVDPATQMPSNALFYSLVQEDDRARMLSQQNHSADTGQIFDEEYRIIRPDGELRYLNSRAQIVPRGKDRTNRFLGIVRDITDQKMLEQKLQSEQLASERAQADLIHLSRVNAMGTMAAAMAHELNQPLASIVNYTAGLIRIVNADPSREELLAPIQEVQNAAHRASEIIKRLRSMTSRGEVKKEAVDVAGCINEAVELALTGTRLTPRIDVAGDLKVVADRIQLEQVLVNLLRNALEAVGDQEDPQISVTASATGGFVEIAVADNGAGIRPDILPKVFDSFVSTKPEGMGMGLAISRTIMEDHGGTLNAVSIPGEGSTFAVTLPEA